MAGQAADWRAAAAACRIGSRPDSQACPGRNAAVAAAAALAAAAGLAAAVASAAADEFAAAVVATSAPEGQIAQT